MQIAIEIRHEFGDLSAFANFAAKLQSLFSEFAPVATVRVAEPLRAAKAAYDEATANRAPTPNATFETPAQREPHSDTVTEAPSLPGAAYAEALASVPVSEPIEDKPKAKRGRPRNADKATEPAVTPAPVYLPAAGSFGGPAVASPPATAPAPDVVSQSPTSGAANSADELAEARAFCLNWVGRNRNGNPRYLKILAKYQDKAAGKVRLQDLDASERAALIAELKAAEAKGDE